ncbi:hypothetical protein ACWGI8_03195 [Streptomyces sp. NPDC054841]
MERRTGLNRAVIRGMLAGNPPPGVEAFTAFLNACRVVPEQRTRWMEAWDRVEAEQASRPA